MIRKERVVTIESINFARTFSMELITRPDGRRMILFGSFSSSISMVDFNDVKSVEILKLFDVDYTVPLICDVPSRNMFLAGFGENLVFCDYTNEKIVVDRDFPALKECRVYVGDHSITDCGNGRICIITHAEELIFFGTKKKNIIHTMQVMNPRTGKHMILDEVRHEASLYPYLLFVSAQRSIKIIHLETYEVNHSFNFEDDFSIDYSLDYVLFREETDPNNEDSHEYFLVSFDSSSSTSTESVEEEIFPTFGKSKAYGGIVVMDGTQHIRYSYGKSCFVGFGGGKVFSIDEPNGYNVLADFYSIYHPEIIVKNRGRDVLLCYQLTREDNKLIFMHLVNENVRVEESDPFEEERLEYMRNMEHFDRTNEVKKRRIVSSYFDIHFFKSFLLC